MGRTVLIVLCLLAPSAVSAEEHDLARGTAFSTFGAGRGPRIEGRSFRLLDPAGVKRQSNAVAFDYDNRWAGLSDLMTFHCRLRVLEGGDGGSFLFLNTEEYGTRGPAPFCKSWVEPNLRGTFAVGIDVHDPPSKEQFSRWGNYRDEPQREVSLHFDGREIVKRVAQTEFRGDFATVVVVVKHVVGGADVSVKIGEEQVYDRYFVAHLHPYRARLAIGAGTRADATTEFDVNTIVFNADLPAKPRRAPLHVEVFNHVLTDNARTAYAKEVVLPPSSWAFGRVIMTIDIHDAGEAWDEWDRNGEVSVWDAEGVKRGIVPFITSYRTECHWKVDVTHFRPWLSGATKIEIAAGTTFYKNRGYMMSLSLDYHHGTPDREPFRVLPLWVGLATYKSAENHYRDFFTPQTVTVDAETTAARFFCTTTGHSQVGEFTPSQRTLVVERPGAVPHRFDNRLWKTDVYLNPNRPQFGTWQYSRAGWAPGDVVRPWILDLTKHVSAGEETVFRYEPQPYAAEDLGGQATPAEVNAANQVVRAYLVLYRTPKASVAAPTMVVTQVEAKSNAAKAGMKAGDYLATYDGRTIDSVDDLRAAIQGALGRGSEKVTVVVYRGGEPLELVLDAGRMGINLGAR